MDKLTPEQRSKNMASIRSKYNKTTEIKFAKLLRSHSIIGWRRHRKEAYGSPDFLFPKEKVAVFIDGCFWHGCPRHCTMPKSNMEYWQTKIERNKLRDMKVNRFYRAKEWKVLRVWEHELKNNSEKKLKKLHLLLSG